MTERLVGVRVVAPRLNMHWKTLQIACREGRSPIPCRLISTGWVFRESDVDRHIAELFADETDSRAIGQAATG